MGFVHLTGLGSHISFKTNMQVESGGCWLIWVRLGWPNFKLYKYIHYADGRILVYISTREITLTFTKLCLMLKTILLQLAGKLESQPLTYIWHGLLIWLSRRKEKSRPLLCFVTCSEGSFQLLIFVACGNIQT